MRRWLRRVAAAGAAALVLASAAPAAFNAAATAGPQSLTAATLAPPTDTNARPGFCLRNVFVVVDISWTMTSSTFADGYEILRAPSSSGPYNVVGTVSGRATTSFVDTGVAFSTTYWYAVRAKRSAWRSVSSTSASVTTPNSRCR